MAQRRLKFSTLVQSYPPAPTFWYGGTTDLPPFSIRAEDAHCPSDNTRSIRRAVQLSIDIITLDFNPSDSHHAPWLISQYGPETQGQPLQAQLHWLCITLTSHHGVDLHGTFQRFLSPRDHKVSNHPLYDYPTRIFLRLKVMLAVVQNIHTAAP